MKVSAQYAVSHFEELLSAQDRGEEVEIARESKPSLVLVAKPESQALATRPRSELFGSWIGKAWLSEDFDSPALNQEIEDEFLKGNVFPDEKP